MKVRHLFSGGGNDALGFFRAGMEIAELVEIDPFRRGLLRQVFPTVPIQSDVRRLDPDDRYDIVTGGPPCQRTSIAAAIHGQRTGETMWPAMCRLSVAARWVVVEQPPKNKAWETQVARDLADSGFQIRRFEYGAEDLGAPHPRRRVFLVAHRNPQRLEITRQALPSEIDGFARRTPDRNPWHAPPGDVLRLDDGLSPAARKAWIEMLGDSIPWPMTFVLARAILTAEAAPC